MSDTDEEEDGAAEELKLDQLLQQHEDQMGTVPKDGGDDEIKEKKVEVTKSPSPQPPSPPSETQFDMFGDEATELPKLTSVLALTASGDRHVEARLADDLLDEEGYYAFRLGETLHKRYTVEGKYGSGVFSVVLKVRDAQTSSPVAVKVNKANSVMSRAGNKELGVLKLLAERDPQGKRHCVRLLDSFSHRNHVCIVLEPLEGSLRDILNKYGKSAGRIVGLSAAATRSYSKQIATGLKFLADCGFVHTDMKPDNLLVTSDLQTVKISDFGSTIRPSEAELTPNIASRYYRPPEVILGFLISYPLDMWALGCIVFELFTGQVMFPGDDNAGMLHLMQQMKGGLPKRMVKHAEFRDEYFNENNKFIISEMDPVTKAVSMVPKTYTNHTTQLKGLLDASVGQSPDASQKTLLSSMRDFIDRSTSLDPSSRMTAEEATTHPFVSGKVSGTVVDQVGN